MKKGLVRALTTLVSLAALSAGALAQQGAPPLLMSSGMPV